MHGVMIQDCDTGSSQMLGWCVEKEGKKYHVFSRWFHTNKPRSTISVEVIPCDGSCIRQVEMPADISERASVLMK